MKFCPGKRKKAISNNTALNLVGKKKKANRHLLINISSQPLVITNSIYLEISVGITVCFAGESNTRVCDKFQRVKCLTTKIHFMTCTMAFFWHLLVER